MNSSFPNTWSFSYLKFTKYVTNIIVEPKYKYGQQEKVTVRNHNRKAAPTSRVFSRRHAATVTLQCKTEFHVHSALLVMHFSHLLFEISLVNQNSHVTHVP